MEELFNSAYSGAKFSEDRKYRYLLYRVWDKTKPLIIFIGLNPSTANETSNDPTIRKVIKFAATWGCGGVYMMNLFAYVTPYPGYLKQCPDPIGDNYIYFEEVQALKIQNIIFAWGNSDVLGRDKKIIKMFPHAKCLAINKNGSPKHPLYVKGDVTPKLFKGNRYQKI